jgi:hypothetical protein
MFRVLTPDHQELTKGQGFESRTEAELAATNAIDEIHMQQVLQSITHKYFCIEVYLTIDQKQFKATVFDQAQRRRYFTSPCKSVESAIADAKHWIDSEEGKW